MNEFRFEVYKLLAEFIRLLNINDQRGLEDKFNVCNALAEEIQEVIREYYPGEGVSLGIAPFELAFLREKFKRPNIQLFEMNDGNGLGAECVLWVDGKSSEPILHVEFFEQDSNLKLQYKYIGS